MDRTFFLFLSAYFLILSAAFIKKNTHVCSFINFLRESLLISAAVDITPPLSYAPFAAVVGKADGW